MSLKKAIDTINNSEIFNTNNYTCLKPKASKRFYVVKRYRSAACLTELGPEPEGSLG